MNKWRRIMIDDAISYLEKAKEILETVLEEEQEYFDNMPEGLQSSEKGDKAQEAISNLDVSVDALDTVISDCESAEG